MQLVVTRIVACTHEECSRATFLVTEWTMRHSQSSAIDTVEYASCKNGKFSARSTRAALAEVARLLVAIPQHRGRALPHTFTQGYSDAGRSSIDFWVVWVHLFAARPVPAKIEKHDPCPTADWTPTRWPSRSAARRTTNSPRPKPSGSVESRR